MKKTVFHVTLLLSLLLLFSCAVADGPVRSIKSIDCTPLYKGVDFSFTAEGHQILFIQYKSSQESGQFLLRGEDGFFTGHLDMPLTYDGSNVFITVNTLSNKPLIEKYNTRTLIPCPDPVPQQQGRLTGLTVCIDAGHSANGPKGSEPRGPGLNGTKAQGNGMAQGTITRRKESVVNLEISFRLRDELLRNGANVVMTRTDEQACLTNLDRDRIAEEGNADIMLRLHCNAVENTSKTGIQVYAPLNSTYAKANGTAADYRRWGDLIRTAMQQAVGTDKGNTALTDEYTGNNWAKMPCFLIEMGYMTTPSEDLLLSDPAYQQLLAEGMTEGCYLFGLDRGILQPE